MYQSNVKKTKQQKFGSKKCKNQINIFGIKIIQNTNEKTF